MINNETIKKIFGSNTRIKLFDLFLNNQGSKYYVREISRIIDEQINSVRRELNNLHQIGMINKIEEDRKLYYSLNKNFEFYLALCNIFNEECQDCLSQGVKNTQSEINWQEEIKQISNVLEYAYISGQFLDSENDIDLLLIGDNSNQDISNWAADLESKTNKIIKYVIMDLDDYNYRKIINDKFLSQYFKAENKKIY